MTISERVRLDGASAARRTALLPARPALISEAQRLQTLLEQQEALAAALAAGGVAREELLAAYAAVLERVLPGTCWTILLFDTATRRVQLSSAGLDPADHASGSALIDLTAGPAGSAVSEWRRVSVSDFAVDARWPDHAGLALARGYRSCWIDPVRTCGDEPALLVAGYGVDPAEPAGAEERLIRLAVPFLVSSLNAIQQREALQRATERFSSLSAALPGVVYQRVVRPDGDIRYTYISEGARELFGIAPEEILSNPQALFSRHDAEYAAKFRERLIAASKSLTMWDVEATIVTPDGRKKYTHAIARPERQQDGSVVWTGVILDETRTREALVESLSQGVVLYDAQDKLILRNSHFLQIYHDLAEVAVPGASYEDVIRAEMTDSFGVASGELEDREHVQARLHRHREPHSMFEQQLKNGRWVLVNEHRTAEGGTVVLYTDITELKLREQQIDHLANHDGLTGLANRRLFNRQIERALDDARRDGTALAILCLDLDHFKSVNDSLGHAAGDALLKAVGERLQSLLRPSDCVARLGGDEFGIIVTDLKKAENAAILAYRLLRAVAEPVDFKGHQLTTGLSIGIANSATDGTDPEMLLKNADLALYRAKADGRGTFRFFESEMDAKAQARRALEIALRDAVAKNELELHYQPQVETQTGQVVGFEALVRWRHPEMGLVPPSEFIPLAEETGIINSLGEWVLKEACLEARRWPSSVKVAVNVSPAQFRKRNLAETVARVLRETGLPAERLDIEVTESLLLRDVESSLSTLRALKDLGVQISMDDFGTGYSSLGNLRSFPFDKIKIDKSFVSEVERSEDSAAIVRAVLGLGRSLGMATCAEGVETKEQLDCLRTEGCTLVQGFLYSKPRPAAEIGDLLPR